MNNISYIIINIMLKRIVMAPLTTLNIESELSYAYLHAVASRAGMNCKVGNRHDDNNGVDAEVRYNGNTGHAYIREVVLDIQLKATILSPGTFPNHQSYNLQGIHSYDRLRTRDSVTTKILVVLFLPNNPVDWLNCSPTELILKEAAYWVCLQGQPATSNATGITVYLPKVNLLSPANLVQLAKDAANNSIPNYTTP